jgi:ribokinase
MDTRLKLLELASQHAFLRVSAITSQEARTSQALEVIECTDLLALNLEEAAAFAGQPTNQPVEAILEAAREKDCKSNPQVHLSITAGKAGSWCWDERSWTHTPSIPVVVAGTAGAGDAHLAGIIAGLAAGLPLPLAQQLGTLAAACSITSPDTINTDLDRAALAAYCQAWSRHVERSYAGLRPTCPRQCGRGQSRREPMGGAPAKGGRVRSTCSHRGGKFCLSWQ